ncbi:isoamylase early set domain-containing protein [Marinitenerispora sediminis]|uniref:Isoamylase n=1 Tax=Marinitenerispora sediminis TaxID=1931232 RepID=A0A368SXY9_9ACTN|nr:isoamylase early set domain-containing protein [Marinitenerispora sediminis]RCV47819.1 isoamylase [Marinitenerispora sediminis]RCV47957.1 isoamylase [Marinitenerispora sediminis]RCV48346.1 isoamylase [Marinitenerispora sediminis]
MIKRGKPDKDGVVRVTFSLPPEEPPGPVSLVGCFNGWDPYAHPLTPRSNGRRSVAISAPAASTLHFRYLGDNGVWFDDEDADALHPDGGRLHL